MLISVSLTNEEKNEVNKADPAKNQSERALGLFHESHGKKVIENEEEKGSHRKREKVVDPFHGDRLDKYSRQVCTEKEDARHHNTQSKALLGRYATCR